MNIKYALGLLLLAACSRQTIKIPLAEDLDRLRVIGVAAKPPVPEVVATGVSAGSAVLTLYAAVPSGQEVSLAGLTANGNLKIDPATMKIAAPTYEEHAGFRLVTFLVTVPIPTQASFRGANAAGTTTDTAAAATPESPASPTALLLAEPTTGSGTGGEAKEAATTGPASSATTKTADATASTTAKTADATASATTPTAAASAGTTAAANASGTSAAAKALAAVSGTISYSFAVTSGSRTETADGEVHVAGTGSTDLAITAPTLTISAPTKDGTIPKGGGTLALDYTLASQEGVTVGWFVSDGEVKNRRDASTNWVPSGGANHTAIGTIRTNRTFGFALQVVDVDTE